MTSIHLGLDVGGSTTRAALVDAEGALLGEGRAGPSLPRAVGIERARAAWLAALAAAWAAAGRAVEPLAGIGAGFAGAREADEQRQLAEWLAAVLAPGAPVRVDHDLGIAHRGAFRSAAGVVVVAGTGSAAFARSEAGEEALVGGFGPFADDAGSGFDLGRGAIAACLRALDGRGEPTRLLAACLEELRCADSDELVSLARAARIPRTVVAGLAQRLLVEVREGDRVASALLERAVDELALAAVTAARRVGLGQPRVAGVGGLFGDATFAHGFARALAARLPTATPTRPLAEPAQGAALWSWAGFRELGPNVPTETPYRT
ncbi:MAG: BadF/BadG/BcrA/BcrD ATPase family protein [Planctomycetota bacterium]